MGSVDLDLARDLARAAGLQRAIETGTFKGRTARSLALVFPRVITIEWSEQLHRDAAAALADTPSIEALQGHSARVLQETRDPAVATLYFLDGHWSGGATAGAEDECPVLGELEAVAGGHPDDCVIIDDARLFASAPPPPHRPEAWPTLLELFDAVRATRPGHLVTVLGDQVIAVPSRARPAIDAYGHRLGAATRSPLARASAVAFGLRERLFTRR